MFLCRTLSHSFFVPSCLTVSFFEPFRLQSSRTSCHRQETPFIFVCNKSLYCNKKLEALCAYLSSSDPGARDAHLPQKARERSWFPYLTMTSTATTTETELTVPSSHSTLLQACEVVGSSESLAREAGGAVDNASSSTIGSEKRQSPKEKQQQQHETIDDMHRSRRVTKVRQLFVGNASVVV